MIVEIIDDLSTIRFVSDSGNYDNITKSSVDNVSVNNDTVIVIANKVQYSLDYTDITTPVVASAVALEQAINAMLDNVPSGGGGGGGGGLDPSTLTTFADDTIGNIAASLSGTSGTLHGYEFQNDDPNPIYVRFYNKVYSSVTPASDIPFYEVVVPNGQVVSFDEVGIYFSNAISIRCVTGFNNTDTVAPTLGTYKIKVRYK